MKKRLLSVNSVLPTKTDQKNPINNADFLVVAERRRSGVSQDSGTVESGARRPWAGGYDGCFRKQGRFRGAQ